MNINYNHNKLERFIPITFIELKTSYHLFNPDRDTITLQNHDTNMDNISKQFIDNIKELLNDANYQLLTQEEIALAINETSPYGVEVNVDLNNFDELLLFLIIELNIWQNSQKIYIIII